MTHSQENVTDLPEMAVQCYMPIQGMLVLLPGGAVGPDIFVKKVDWQTERDETLRLRAEVEALVPLARWALFAISEAYARESNIVSRELLNEAERAGLYDPNDMDDVMDNMPKIIAARRIVEGTDA